MTNNYMNSALNMGADLCGIKTNLVAGEVENSLMFSAEIEVDKASLETLLQLFGDRTREKAGPFVKMLDDFELTAKFAYHKQKTFVAIDTQGLHFLAYDGLQGKLVAFSMTPQELLNGDDALSQVAKGVFAVFGLRNFCFLYRNTNITSADIYKSYSFLPKVPAIIEGDVLLNASFQFDEIAESTFVKAMNTIFGISGMDIFLGVGSQQVSCALVIPDITNKLLTCQNITMSANFSKEAVLFRMAGGIWLTCLPGLKFYVNSEFGLAKVSISASSMQGSVFQIPGTMLSICNCGLEIGYNGMDISLAAMSQINIRNLMWYGALGMSVNATGIPTLDMVSMAMNEVSISSLVSNLTGISNSDIAMLDIFAIKPFDVNHAGKIDFTTLSEEEIINEVNTILPTNYKLTANTASVTKLPGNKACDVLDTKTMFHYWIDENKKLSFPPQAYYAGKHITIGAYHFEQGIFFAGKMVLFDKSIKIMFSAVKDKGLLGYAQMDAISNKVIVISGSNTALSKVNPVLGNSTNSTLELLATDFHRDNEIARPVILYMDATRNACSFYLDGHIELCKVFSFDTMMYFSNRRVRLAVETTYFNMIKTALYLDADYQKLTKLAFEFMVSLDTTGLQRNLQKLSGLLTDAVSQYDKKINEAQRKLDDAKRKVSSLQREINSYNAKIQTSKNKIKKAKKIQIILKTKEAIKIVGYEVAIAGIYLAMKTAQAALDVASKTLSVANKLGSGFLNAINAVVQGVLNVFYISQALLHVIINGTQMLVNTELNLTVLGKQIEVKEVITLDKLINNPIGLLEELTIGQIKDILDSLKMGEAPQYEAIEAIAYPYMTLPEDTSELAELVAYGGKRIEQAKNLMEALQDLYVEEMKEAEPEFTNMETEFKEEAQMISYSLQKATENIYNAGMDDLMVELDSARDSGELTEAEYAEMESCIQDYMEVIRPTSTTMTETCNRVNDCVESIEVGRMAAKLRTMRKDTQTITGAEILEERDFDEFFGNVQTTVEKYFPKGSGHGYFNITDEDYFYESLNDAREEAGCAYVNTAEDTADDTTEVQGTQLFRRSLLAPTATPGYIQRLKDE